MCSPQIIDLWAFWPNRFPNKYLNLGILGQWFYTSCSEDLGTALILILFFFFNTHTRTCLLILERGEGRERERERNTDVREEHRSFVPCLHLDQGPAQNRDMCPDQDSNPQPLGPQDPVPTSWSTPSRAKPRFVLPLLTSNNTKLLSGLISLTLAFLSMNKSQLWANLFEISI